MYETSDRAILFALSIKCQFPTGLSESYISWTFLQASGSSGYLDFHVRLASGQCWSIELLDDGQTAVQHERCSWPKGLCKYILCMDHVLIGFRQTNAALYLYCSHEHKGFLARRKDADPIVQQLKEE